MTAFAEIIAATNYSFLRGASPAENMVMAAIAAGYAGLSRDYYRVEDRLGRRFWLFRHGLYGREAKSPAWYIHGLFAWVAPFSTSRNLSPGGIIRNGSCRCSGVTG